MFILGRLLVKEAVLHYFFHLYAYLSLSVCMFILGRLLVKEADPPLFLSSVCMFIFIRMYVYLRQAIA